MTDFKQIANRITRKFQKRVGYDREQFYDLDVTIRNVTGNNSYKIEITSSQILHATLEGDAEELEKLANDILEIIKL